MIQINPDNVFYLNLKNFQHESSYHFTSLHFTSLHFTSLHFTSLHFRPLFDNSVLRTLNRKYVLLIISLISTIYIGSAQSICSYSNPCRVIDGPVFPGGSTLCESVTGFDPDYTIIDGLSASELNLTLWPQNLTDFNNVDILIQGVFYIDEPTAFMNCRVKLASGAQIVVTQEIIKTEILAFQSKFFSCDDMWKGIVLEQGARCRFYSNRLEDAEFGITVGKYVYLALYGNRFNRNFVSLTNASGTSSLPLILFKNNTFDCTTALSDYDELDFPCCDEDPVSFAGILLNNCSSSIGYFNSQNRFNNLNYGIVANNSTAYIKGCLFNDAQISTIIPDLIQDEPSVGCGILGINSSLYINGDDENQSANFDNAGIFTLGSNLDVSYADFVDCGIGASESFFGQTVIIEENTFTGINRPSTVGVQRSMASGDAAHTYITHNTFTHEESPFDAVWTIHLNGTYDPTDHAYINFNTLNSSGLTNYNGIRYTVSKSENTHIIEDTINMKSTDLNTIGIHCLLGNARGSEVSDNQLMGDSDDFDIEDSSIGILAFTASDITYCNNTTDSLLIGMQFAGDCSASSITQNEINYHIIGMQLKNSIGHMGNFGIQEGTRNEWLLEDLDDYYLAAQNTSSLDPNLTSYVIAEDDGSNPIFNPQEHDINLVAPTTSWFDVDDVANNLCLESIHEISAYDSIVLTGFSGYSELSDPVKFFMKKRLIYKLLSEVDFRIEYDDYLSSVDTDSEYLLALAEYDLKMAMQMDLDDQADLDILRDSLHFWYDSLSVYDEINYASIDTTTFALELYSDTLTSLLENCDRVKGFQEEIKSDRETELMTALAIVADSLDRISTRATFDESYRFIYSMFIKKLLNGSLEPTDYDDLNAIAQDYADSSFANITARALFNLCSDATYPDYDFECETLPSISPKNNAEDISFQEYRITIEQNDTDLFINSTELFTGYLMLYDLSGRVIKSEKLKDVSSHTLTGNNLVPGVYYWTLSGSTSHTVLSSGLWPIYQ